MQRLSIATLMMIMLVAHVPRAAAAPKLADLLRAFQAHSGARLVFDRRQLPTAAYYERMPKLSTTRQRPPTTRTCGE